ncbi:MAG: hypothetical protein AAFX53_18910 [Bacteroidota bacterium]
MGSKKEWMNNPKNVKMYMRLFFDNVAGRNGRFEIIEPYLLPNGKYTKSFHLLVNRIDTHYKRTVLSKKEDSPEAIPEEASEENFKFNKDLKTYFEQIKLSEKTIDLDSKDGIGIWEKCHMIFKNGLFTSDIIMDLSGNIEMNDEKQLSHESIRNIIGKGKGLDKEPLNQQSDIHPLSETQKEKLQVEQS